MADKMLRVAGRGIDGTAKAIQTTIDGNLDVRLGGKEIENSNSYLRKFIETSLMDRKDIYFFGKDYVSFVGVEQIGNANLSKENDHIKLTVVDNPLNNATLEMASDAPVIDKGEVFEKLVVEYEIIGTGNYNSQVRFHVRNAKSPIDANVGREDAFLIRGGKGERMIREINVTGLNNNYEYFLGVRLRDVSTTDSIDATLKIYNVYLIKNKSQMLSIEDKDIGTQSTLTTVKDTSGKDVLRVVDAAPFGYDELENMYDVKIASNKVKEVFFLKHEELRSADHFQTDMIDISHMGGEKMLVVRNILDVPVKVQVYGPYSASRLGGGGRTIGNDIVSSGSNQYYSKADLDLLGLPVSKLILRITPQSTPTTGSVTAYVAGV